MLVTYYLTECPTNIYECLVRKPDGSTMDCAQSEGTTTVSTFDSVSGVFEFQSSDPFNSIYQQRNQYSVEIKVYAGIPADNIFAVATLVLDLPCMIESAAFPWTID